MTPIRRGTSIWCRARKVDVNGIAAEKRDGVAITGEGDGHGQGRGRRRARPGRRALNLAFRRFLPPVACRSSILCLKWRAIGRQSAGVAARQRQATPARSKGEMKQALRMSSAAVALAVGLGCARALRRIRRSTPRPAPAHDRLAAPASEDAVGPAQLRDFSINGTVTRRADDACDRCLRSLQPGLRPQQPRRSPPARRPRATHAVASRADATGYGAPSSARAAAAAAPPTAATVRLQLRLPPTPATCSVGGALRVRRRSRNRRTPASPVAERTRLLRTWPWLLALLAAVGAGALVFPAQRSGYAFAGAGGDASAFDFSPAPAPPRAAPMPQPAACSAPRRFRMPAPRARQARDRASGIVSTRLRPWLEIEFSPAGCDRRRREGRDPVRGRRSSIPAARPPATCWSRRAVQRRPGPGSGARRILRPAGWPGGDRTSIPPLQRMSFRSTRHASARSAAPVRGRGPHAVRAAGRLQRPLSLEQRRRARRRRAIIVGRNANGEKMAPFRVDQGAEDLPRPRRARAHAPRPQVASEPLGLADLDRALVAVDAERSRRPGTRNRGRRSSRGLLHRPCC